MTCNVFSGTLNLNQSSLRLIAVVKVGIKRWLSSSIQTATKTFLPKILMTFCSRRLLMTVFSHYLLRSYALAPPLSPLSHAAPELTAATGALRLTLTTGWDVSHPNIPPG